MIYGFEAYKATCSYHGREWVVWYSPEIPFSDGPWVFCGLPGLILEAQDKAHLFSFRLVGLMSNQELKKDWLGKGEKIDRISKNINIGKTSNQFLTQKWEQTFLKIKMTPAIWMD